MPMLKMTKKETVVAFQLNLWPRLNTLQIPFSDLEVMQKLKSFPFENLIRFDFNMKNYLPDGDQLLNRVHLNKINVSTVLETNISELLRRSAELTLREAVNLKNLFENIIGTQNNSNALRYLLSLSMAKVLVNLLDLVVAECHALEQIIMTTDEEEEEDGNRYHCVPSTAAS
ncbi:hypothetical protein LguiB_004137 [Lonicera macranthoides]